MNHRSGANRRRAPRSSGRHSHVGAQFDDASLCSESVTLQVGMPESDMNMARGVAEQVGGMSVTDNSRKHNSAPRGEWNITPDGGCGKVGHNMGEPEYQSPKVSELSTKPDSSSRCNRRIQSTKVWVEKGSSPYFSLAYPACGTSAPREPSRISLGNSSDRQSPLGGQTGRSAVSDESEGKSSTCELKSSSFPVGGTSAPREPSRISVGNSSDRQSPLGGQTGRSAVSDKSEGKSSTCELESSSFPVGGTSAPREPSRISVGNSSDPQSPLGGQTGRSAVSDKSEGKSSTCELESSSFENCSSPYSSLAYPVGGTSAPREPSRISLGNSSDLQSPLGGQTGRSAVSDKSEGKSSTCELKSSSFDICLGRSSGVKLKPSLLVKNKERKKEMKNLVEGQNIDELRPGMVLLRGFLSLTEQVKLIKTCQDLGRGPGGFYQPGYSDGAKLHLKMMCLGKSWDPVTSSYSDERPFDRAKPPVIPEEFQLLVRRAIQECHAYLESCAVSNAKDILPSMMPNICIVNFYAESGKLGLHQDKDESKESLDKGLPVVSFSVGDSADFLYGDDRNVDKAEKVVLRSGDVLIFGGGSRHIFHGVTTINPGTAPKSLLEETDLRPGRLNLTFREY